MYTGSSLCLYDREQDRLGDSECEEGFVCPESGTAFQQASKHPTTSAISHCTTQHNNQAAVGFAWRDEGC